MTQAFSNLSEPRTSGEEGTLRHVFSVQRVALFCVSCFCCASHSKSIKCYSGCADLLLFGNWYPPALQAWAVDGSGISLCTLLAEAMVIIPDVLTAMVRVDFRVRPRS